MTFQNIRDWCNLKPNKLLKNKIDIVRWIISAIIVQTKYRMQNIEVVEADLIKNSIISSF